MIRPSRWQAEHAYRCVGAWLAEINERLSTTSQNQQELEADHSTQASIIIDLSEADRLDLTALGLLLSKLSDAGITVRVTGAAPHLAISLHSLTQWAAEHAATVVVDESHDGPGWAVVNLDERAPLTVAIPSQVRRLLRLRARRWGATPDDVVAAALYFYLTRPAPPVLPSDVSRSQAKSPTTSKPPLGSGGSTSVT